jgi:hypothetical protein
LDVVNGDKGYDSDGLREQIRERGALADIPPKANRKEKPCFSPFLYRDRNAANFLAAGCLAAAVSYWL